MSACTASRGEGLPAGRHVAIVGDAELDEGNIYEALLEGWKHDIRNVWWVIDYNRQSLDSVVPDRLFGRIEGLFRDMGWNVVTLKYGRKLEAAFARPGGEALRRWIDDCPNSLYAALTFQGGAAWRQALLADLGRDEGIRAIIDPLTDDELAALMTNLGGHDIETLIEAFRAQDAEGDQPTCFIAYTIKGMGLPFAGHKDNHAGLMTKEQMESFRSSMRIRDGHEWDPSRGSTPRGRARGFLAGVPFAQPLTPEGGARLAHRSTCPPPAARGAAGRKPPPRRPSATSWPRSAAGRGEAADLAKRIVTTSPDVTVSTNLGPWVNRRGIFDRHKKNDVFRDAKLASAQRWGMSPEGQHVELGIAEQNLFLLPRRWAWPTAVRRAAAADRHGLRPLRQPRPRCADLCLLPGCALPAGLHALGPDARARGRAAPIGQHAADRHGGRTGWPASSRRMPTNSPSCCATPSTTCRSPMARRLAAAVHPRAGAAGAGARPGGGDRRGYWACRRRQGARIAIAYQGAVAPEAMEAFEALRGGGAGAGLLAITSPDRLHAAGSPRGAARRGGRRASHIERCWRRSPRCRDRHRAGRAPGGACLDGRGARAARGAARRGPLRPGGRHPGPLSGIRPALPGLRSSAPWQSASQPSRRARWPGTGQASLSGKTSSGITPLLGCDDRAS
jgi:pyruvate dehydrogenase E1 component